jgi:hypothetical protein
MPKMMTDRDKPITWARIVEARPTLATALDTAQRLSRRSPGYCANRTFYGIFKPILRRQVGNEIELRCQRLHLQTLSRLDEPVVHTAECVASIDRQRWLKGRDVYDLVYETLYHALPNCQHDGECY